VLTNGFGIIAFISVTPLIAVQALGILYEAQSRRAQALLAEAEHGEIEELAHIAAQARETADAPRDDLDGAPSAAPDAAAPDEALPDATDEVTDDDNAPADADITTFCDAQDAVALSTTER
jgi:hypothetical protein